MKTQAFTASIAFLLLAQVAKAETKVTVDVYYETLCPDSIGFLVRQLIPSYDTLSSMMQLNLIPFGKAEIYEFRETVDFYCQHGPKECRGNMLHACVFKEHQYNYTRVLPFVECMEYDLKGKPKPNVDLIATNCAKENDIDWDKIESCASGSQGKQLLMEAGKKTKALRPKLSFVPTIVINEKYSDSNQNKALYGDFSKLVCSNYADTPVPSACKSAN